MEPAITLPNNTLALLINNIQKTQLSLTDWQTEKLNFVPLRGSWFANSEADFDLEAEIEKFMLPQNNKKVMLLMGDSGAGKSLYTQGLVNKSWQNFSAQSAIPIWISLSSLKDPVNRAIEEAFEKYGFTKKQIGELRKTRSFIFILDAYDEIRCEKNLYQTNNLDKWNAKIIFTCRREYLYHKDNYKIFFAPFIGDKIQYSQYEEIYIKPFNVNQIQSYVQQYIKARDTQWNNPERYVKAMEEITGLKELIKTPFMLKLTMEVLPQIVEKYATQNIQERKEVTQAALYDVFIEQWFIRQEQKLKQAKQIKENEDIKPEFWIYAKELALEMHKANLTQVVYNANEESDLFSTEIKQNPWAKFFTPKNPKVELLITACLVKETNQHHYAFMHLSLLEYFLTRNLYENITTQNTVLTANQAQIVPKAHHLPTKQTIAAAATSTTVTNNYNNQLRQISKADYFNERLLVKEENTLQFLADRVAEQETFKTSLFDMVYSSRNNPLNKIAASNAITILNRANIPFSCLDLSGIQIQEADLSFALLDQTNISNADLTGVILRNAWLRFANLSNCNMHGTYFGESPVINIGHKVKYAEFSADRSILVIVDNKIININTETGETLFTLNDDHPIIAFDYCKEEKILATGNESNEIVLWDILLQKKLKSIKSSANGSKKLAICMNKQFIIYGNKNASVFVMDIESNQQQQIKDNNPKRKVTLPESVSALYFNDDSKHFIFGTTQGNICVWSINTHNVFKRFHIVEHYTNDHTNSDRGSLPNLGETINHIRFNKNQNMIAIGCKQKGVVLLNCDTDNQFVLSQIDDCHGENITDIAFNSNGQLLIAGNNEGTIYLYDVVNKKELNRFYWHSTEIACLKFEDDGDLSILSMDISGNIKRWSVSDLNLVHKCFNNIKTVTTLVFSANGKYLLSGGDTKARLWDTKAKKLLSSYELSLGILCGAFNPSGEIIALAGWDREITLFNIETKAQVKLKQHDKPITAIAFSFNGKFLVSASSENNEAAGHWNLLDSAAAKDNPIHQIYSHDQSVRLWDLNSNHQLKYFTLGKNPHIMTGGNMGNIYAVAFSSITKYIAFTNEDNIYLWEHEKDSYHILRGHRHMVLTISFSFNNKYIASGSSDRTVRIWDIKTFEEIHILKSHMLSVRQVVFNTHNMYLATGGEDEILRVWDIAEVTLLASLPQSSIICNISFRNTQLAVNCIDSTIKIYEKDPLQNKWVLMWLQSNYSLTSQYCCIGGVRNLSIKHSQLLKQLGAIESSFTSSSSNAYEHIKISLQKLIENDKYNYQYRYYFILAMIHKKQGNTIIENELYQKISQLNKFPLQFSFSYHEMRVVMVYALIKIKHWDNAKIIFKQEENDPDKKLDLKYIEGLWYEEQKEFIKAEECYTQVKELNRNYRDILTHHSIRHILKQIKPLAANQFSDESKSSTSNVKIASVLLLNDLAANKPPAVISSNTVVKPMQALPVKSPASVAKSVGIYSQLAIDVKPSGSMPSQQIQQDKLVADSKKETDKKSITQAEFLLLHSSQDKEDKEKKNKKDDNKEVKSPSNKKM